MPAMSALSANLRSDRNAAAPGKLSTRGPLLYKDVIMLAFPRCSPVGQALLEYAPVDSVGDEDERDSEAGHLPVARFAERSGTNACTVYERKGAARCEVSRISPDRNREVGHEGRESALIVKHHVCRINSAANESASLDRGSCEVSSECMIYLRNLYLSSCGSP